MKTKIFLLTFFASSFAVWVECTAAAQNFTIGELKNLAYYAHSISEACDSINYYKEQIESLGFQYNKAIDGINKYCQKPFSEMTGTKVDVLPESKENIKDAYYRYCRIGDMLKSRYHKEALKNAQRELSVFTAKGNKDFQSLSEGQRQEFKSLQNTVSRYEIFARDVSELVKAKNTLLIGIVECDFQMDERNWTKAKNNPWKVPTIEDSALDKFLNSIHSLKDKYRESNIITKWLDRYEELLFSKRVVPFTPLPAKEFENIYAKYKHNIKLSEELLDMESRFIVE